MDDEPAAASERAAVAPELRASDTAAAGTPAPATNEHGGDDADVASAAELEELTLPPSVCAPEPLPDGTVVDVEGRLRAERLLETRGRINHYRATWQDDDGGAQPVELREGPAAHAELQREAEVLAAIQYAMLPRCFAAFERDGLRYLAVERVEGVSLADALAAGLSVDEAVSSVVQLAQVLRRLHRAGWALVGLSPADVCLGQPVRLTRLGTAVRIGEAPARPLLVPGYSAPELAQQVTISGKEDVYTLGATLYRALAGHPVPEQGPELRALPAAVPIPGAPQLLALALASADERADLERFYQELLTFRRRLAQAPLALEVASGTTVGLNPTRLVNEDACGYAAWSLAQADGVTHRAVLCVVDGMGGMEAGEVASRVALQAVLQAAAGHAGAPGGGTGEGLGETPGRGASRAPVTETQPLHPIALVQEAARAVHAAAAGRQVGATITCAVIENGALSLGHVGDTRAYLGRDGALTQVTRDHSLVAAMVASGVLTPAEARGHPDSNKVLRSLGGQRVLPDGYVDGLAAACGEATLRLREGDWLLLCSDGVWGVLDDEALLAIIAAAPGCAAAADTIIRQVLQEGAPDNATAIVARCVRPFTH